LKRPILDPRSKLIISFVTMALLMTFSHWAFLTTSLGILIILVLFLQLSRPWFNFLKGLGFAVLTFFLIAWLAFDLTTGIISGLRLLTIGVVFFLFFQTTPPEILSNGLLKIGFPYPFTFVLTASMQFIPVLIRRARNIRDAQRARGIPIEGGLRGILHLPALAGPLLIQSFKFADELAEAMEARGFGISGRRFRYEPHFKWIDWIVVTVSLIVLITALLFKFM
jgi:energy-coupling factor transport system permease protein